MKNTESSRNRKRRKKRSLYLTDELYGRCMRTAKEKGFSFSDFVGKSIERVCSRNAEDTLTKELNPQKNEMDVIEEANGDQKKIHLDIRISEKEMAIMVKNSERANVTLSEYIRRLGVGYRLTSKVDEDAVIALSRLHGDFGKLGGLYKQAFAKETMSRNELHERLSALDALKKEAKEAIQWIRKTPSVNGG